jgi:hypothetical protein
MGISDCGRWHRARPRQPASPFRLFQQFDGLLQGEVLGHWPVIAGALVLVDVDLVDVDLEEEERLAGESSAYPS